MTSADNANDKSTGEAANDRSTSDVATDATDATDAPPPAASAAAKESAPVTPAAPPGKPAPPPTAGRHDVAITGVMPSRPPMAAHSLARIVLAVSGLIWMIIGVWGLADPRSLADTVDLRIDSPLGRLEIRAMYGGLCIAVGVLHGLAASRKVWLMQGLVATGMMTLGLLSGRLLTVALEGVPGPMALLLIGGETSLSAVTAVAIWRLMIATRAANKATKAAANLAAKNAKKAA